MQVINYLTFNEGLCEEAFDLYQRVLGGTVQHTRFSSLGLESPAGRDYLMHAHLVSESIQLMGGDNNPNMPFQKGNALALYLVLPSVGMAQLALRALQQGAKEIVPFTNSNSEIMEGYAYLEDKYGVLWHVSVRAGMRRLLPYVVPMNYKARDLLTHYQSIFKGQSQVIPFNQVDPNYPDGENLIALATISQGTEDLLLLSDATPDMATIYIGSSFALSIAIFNLDQGEHLFSKLSDRGQVIVPYGSTQWTKGYGVTTDRFGNTWQVNYFELP